MARIVFGVLGLWLAAVAAHPQGQALVFHGSSCDCGGKMPLLMESPIQSQQQPFQLQKTLVYPHPHMDLQPKSPTVSDFKYSFDFKPPQNEPNPLDNQKSPLVSYRMEEHLVQQPPKQPQHMFVEYKLQEPQMQQQQHHQHQMEKLTDLKAFEELKTFEELKLFNEQKAFEEKMNLQRPPACTCEGECSCHLKKNKNNNQNYFVAPVHYNMPGQPTFRVKRSSPLKNLKKSTDFKDAKTVAGFKSRPKRSLMQQTSDPLYQPQPEVMQFRSEIISNHIHRPTNSPCPTCASLHPMPMCPTCYAKPPTQLRSPFVEVVQNGEPFVMDPLGHKYKMDESSGSLKLMIPKQFSESMELKPLMDETQLGNSKLEEQDLHFIHETVQGNQHFQKASRPQKKGELTEGALEQQIDFFRYLHELNKQLKPQY